MIKITDNCTGCTACKNLCPSQAISFLSIDGYLKASINDELCMNCNLCKNLCPQINTIKSFNQESVFYLAESKKLDEIVSATSGSIFGTLAMEIISNGGIVFGVEMDPDLSVFHSYCTNIDDLQKYKFSKYVQSDLKNTFNETKYFLENGKEVLFSGTPCQIAGLKAFLKKEYPNLITIDFLCHGVPSPLLFKEHIKWLEKRYNCKIENITFRIKDKGGNPDYASVFNKGKRKIKLNCSTDPYLNAFINSNSLNNACYNCKYASCERYSDITLADAWKGKDNLQYLKSLVMLNSKKGSDLFNKIADYLVYDETNKDLAISYKTNLTVPAKPCNEEISKMLQDYNNYSKYADAFCKTKNYKIHRLYSLLPNWMKNILKK